MRSRSRLFAICLASACLTASLLGSTAQAASPAWQPIAASGPTNLPPVQSEIQRLRVDAEGGTYTLTQETASGSGTLSFGQGFTGGYSSGASQVTFFAASPPFQVGQEIFGPGIAAGTTITAIANVGVINVTLSTPTVAAGPPGFLTASSKVVTGVSTTSGAFHVGDRISVAGTPATGIPAGTTIAAVGANTLTLSANPTANGSRTLTATETTDPIAFDAPAAALEASLNALPALEVSVTGGPGDRGGTKPYFVTFGGAQANTNVARTTADSSGLTGGENHLASITTALEGGPGTAQIAIYPQNVGGAPSSGTVELEFTLPAGVTTSRAPTSDPPAWNCPAGSGEGETGMTCTSTRVAGPGVALIPLVIPVKSSPGAVSGVVHVEVSGGGALDTASYDMPLVISAIPAPPGLQSWTAGAYDENGVLDIRAGAHPYSASTGILVNTVRSPRGLVVPAGEFRDIVADIPPGFLGNPIATEQCPESFEHLDCPHASMMALSQVPLGVQDPTRPSFGAGELAAVSNIEAPRGFPAKFRFLTGDNQVIVNVVASLRSDEDHGVSAGSYNTPQIKPVLGAFFTIWGAPADPGHDMQRCKDFLGGTGDPVDCGPGGEDLAFLTNPVDCAEEAARTPKAVLNVNTWQNPTLLFAGEVALKPVTGCDHPELKEKAANLVDAFGFEPTNTQASDSPASFSAEMIVPSDGLLDPDKRMTPTIRESVVELPEGVVLNASAADGLAACSLAQIGYKGNDFPRPNEIRFTKEPNKCPDASKIGSGSVKSELLEDPLGAELFLASQGGGNPFGSLFAIYLVIEDPDRGLVIKLPGEVQLNGADGQQRIVFRDLPPLPFSSLKLNLKGGPRSPLATPTTCGSYATTATNTPWSAPESGPPHVSSGAFAVDQGPNGQPCAATPADRPFNLGLNAGTDSVAAGEFTPLTFRIARPDGSQELDTLELKLPQGLAASLKGIPYCSEAAIAAAGGADGKQEQASSACPAASQVGRTLVGAGSGPSPFYAPGKLYLAGPYKGAPVSVVAITPAVAGPFDLGTVVVRSGVYVDPVSAQVSAKSDSLPQIVKGVPLRVRDVRVILDRSNFALNPTSCEETAIQARVSGSSGAVANLSDRFQVGGCENLGFKPRIRFSLKGGTKRGDNPALTAVVRPRPGDSNIARAAVTLPRSAFLDQSHIRTVCTRVQFAADACPKAAIYGRAEAVTPLLDQPLTGPVYLRSSNNTLPDLVADLRGPAHQPIKIEAVFRTDSIRGGIRNTLDFAPDAPVTKFTLRMQGGKKGLVVNSQNLCAKTNRAKARLKAHNDRRFNSRPKVVALNCKKQRRGKGKSRRR